MRRLLAGPVSRTADSLHLPREAKDSFGELPLRHSRSFGGRGSALKGGDLALSHLCRLVVTGLLGPVELDCLLRRRLSFLERCLSPS